MVLIHEKITALLEQRRLKKRDLARALAVSPQTATDICKGRSAITLPHLRNLVAFFEVRPDFWLDEERLLPGELDRVATRGSWEALARSGLATLGDPQRLLERVRRFVQAHQDEFLASFPDLLQQERAVLGISEPRFGVAAGTARRPGAAAPGSSGSGSSLPGSSLPGSSGSGSSGPGSSGPGSSGPGSIGTVGQTGD